MLRMGSPWIEIPQKGLGEGLYALREHNYLRLIAGEGE